MGLRERHKAFLEWLTPRRRRRIGGALMVVWALGAVLHPGQYLLYIGIVGIIILGGGLSPGLSGKR